MPERASCPPARCWPFSPSNVSSNAHKAWEEPVWSCHVSSWFSVVYLVLLIHRDWGEDMNGLNAGDRTKAQQKGTRVLGASESFRERVRAAASSIAVILRVDNCYLPPPTCHLPPASPFPVTPRTYFGTQRQATARLKPLPAR